MPIWLLVALIAWPLVPAAVVSYQWRSCIANGMTALADAVAVDVRARSNRFAALETEVGDLKETIRAQEKLIAILWVTEVGFEDRTWTEDKLWSWANTRPLIEKYGTRPHWSLDIEGKTLQRDKAG